MRITLFSISQLAICRPAEVAQTALLQPFSRVWLSVTSLTDFVLLSVERKNFSMSPLGAVAAMWEIVTFEIAELVL